MSVIVQSESSRWLRGAPSTVCVGLMGFEGLSEKEIEAQTLQMLSRSLNAGRMVAFVGSGTSRAYGYPGWNELVTEIVRTVKEECGQGTDELSRRHLEGYLSAPGEGMESGLSSADSNLLALDLCDDILTAAGRSLKKLTLRVFKKMSKDKVTPAPTENPLHHLIEKLRIRRFLTTNYDHEIERALYRILRGQGYPDAAKKADSAPDSSRIVELKAHPSNYEDLIKFAVGAPKYNVGVFHCHGSEEDEDSIIVSERHYQDLYLADDVNHRSYRDALGLAFGGNPILFVGLGMQEPDLLRPLRQFVSEAEQHSSHERPLFALWPRIENEKERYEFRRFLYRRYGVKTYFYACDEANKTKSLCEAIDSVSREWRHWWLRWQEKLPLRKATFGTKGDAMVHHWQPPSHSVIEDDEQIVEELDKRNVVIVHGRPGTGKGSLGHRLARRELAGKWDKVFFSSTHFSNEFLSTLESATGFLNDGRPQERNADPMQQFRQSLTQSNALVVIGGIERLLEAAPAEHAEVAKFRDADARPPLPIGVPASREAERFLECIEQHAREGGRARVVLTTSVQPILNDYSADGIPDGYRALADVTGVHLAGVGEQRIRGLNGFDSGIDSVLIGQFHHAVRGHAYAILVANSVLKSIAEDDRGEWLERVVSHLTSFGLRQRAELVVGEAIKLVMHRPGDGPLLYDVLQKVALCTTPVTVDAIEVMISKHPASKIRTAVDALTSRHLLLRIEHETNQRFTRYTAHTLVRTHVLHSLGGLPDISGEPQSLYLGGFTKGSEDPSSHGVEDACIHGDCVDRLLAHLERSWDSVTDDCDGEKITDDYRNWRALVRTAFGLIRSRWSATGIPRLAALEQPDSAAGAIPHYDAYQRRLARLLNSIRYVLREHLWYDEDITDERYGPIRSKLGPLYADELAWLCNELGLVSYSKGCLPDAYALFRISQDINRNADNGFRGHRWCQAELNLAAVQLERASLPRARLHLTNALRAASVLRDEDILGRGLCYLGLTHHLSGDYEAADRLYKESAEKLKWCRSGRGISVAMRHRGDLLRVRGRLKKAAACLQESIMAAESGNHVDLLWYSRVAQANLRRVGGQVAAGEVLEPALMFARAAGIPKLEADVYKVQAEIALDHGETETASRLAVRCLTIGSALGMRLRVTAALVLLGHVYRSRGQRAAAARMYEAAATMGARQGYQLKAEEATREMLRMQSRTEVG